MIERHSLAFDSADICEEKKKALPCNSFHDRCLQSRREWVPGLRIHGTKKEEQLYILHSQYC